MRIASRNINTRGVEFSKSVLLHSQMAHDNRYANACLKLYDNFYLTTPTVFDKGDFVEMLLKDYPEQSKMLINDTTGAFELEPMMIKYAMFRSNDKTFNWLMHCALDITEAIEASEAFAEFDRAVKIPKRSDKVVAMPRLSVSSDLYNHSTAPLDSPHVMNLVGDGHKKVERRNLGYIYRKYLLKDCNIECSLEESGLLIKDAPVEVECRFIDLLLSGKIKADGTYGEVITARYQKYYADFYLSRDNGTSCVQYRDKIFLDCLEECIDAVKTVRETNETNGFKELYITRYELLYVTNESEEITYDEYDSMYIMPYALVTNTKELLPTEVRLQGVGGEYVSEDSIMRNQWIKKGFPVMIGNIGYYPLYRVFYNDESANIASVVNTEVPFIYTDALSTEMIGILDSFSDGESVKMLSVHYPNTSEESLLAVVGLLRAEYGVRQRTSIIAKLNSVRFATSSKVALSGVDMHKVDSAFERMMLLDKQKRDEVLPTCL